MQLINEILKYETRLSFNLFLKFTFKETISTCRFSQRVALIKNDAILNEELDPRLLINQLRAENIQLRNQILIQNGSEKFNEPLTPELIAK